MKSLITSLILLLHLCCVLPAIAAPDTVVQAFANPPDSSRPGVYWYFMDGNLSRDGMTRDLESMKEAGLGHLVFLEVNVGVPRGPVGFLSEQWQDLFVHAVREAERLGIEITLGSGPGWTGSGGPWVKPEQSMQHLVASTTQAKGPASFRGVLPVAPPRRPFFGDVPAQMRSQWETFYKDVAVLAFPTPEKATAIPDIDEKALVYRAPYSSQPNVKPRLDAPAEFPPDTEGSTIPPGRIINLTELMKPDGSIEWDVPEGNWTILRFVSRNNGASTRPAPDPGIGFECDKFEAAALDAHFGEYVGKLLRKVGPRPPGRGWTMLHIDSWEMGAQNWTPRFRQEFLKRRGYDPQPFYPAYVGHVVGSREQTERFLWDLRITGQELVIENHAEHLKRLGRKHGFGLSIEPYDMNPVNDFDLGAVADVPMCEFWSLGFDTAYSCHTASSIAHVLGLPIVAAEAFTADRQEAWRFYPGSLKNQGDWAFATGINRLTYHTFAHKPDEGRPGMVMGPYGVHWDRGQTWWPMAGEYHRYISRCQHLLRQGRTVADVLYLMPEGAPNVFQPPPSAFDGDSRMPDRRGYNFDGCSPQALMRLAEVRNGRIVFPGGAAYRLLVLPDSNTMTPALVRKLESLVKAGATMAGNPPRKSPSLVEFPACDEEVARHAKALWGGLVPPSTTTVRRFGKGRVIQGEAFRSKAASASAPPVLKAQWIWFPEGEPAKSAPLETVRFERRFVLQPGQNLLSGSLSMTADNAFTAFCNGKKVLEGENFHRVFEADVTRAILPGTNVLTVLAENVGSAPNPAGLIASLQLAYADNSQVIATDSQWTCSIENQEGAPRAARVLGPAEMAPWRLNPTHAVLSPYPHYEITAAILRDSKVPEDFSTAGPLRYTHRTTAEREIYFVANRTDQPVQTSATFRAGAAKPELWNPADGTIRALPQFTRKGPLTEIPLSFEPYESYFIVFPARGATAGVASISGSRNYPELSQVQTIHGSWEVSFDPAMGAPEKVRFESLSDWTRHEQPGIRHYSGVAIYRTTFVVRADNPQQKGTRTFLDLGNVHVMARVRVNGADCGIAWTAPWRVDISRAVRVGSNTLEIEVANLWPNRMIGDAASPERKFTQTTYRPYKPHDPLLPSGLLGPVRILRESD